MKRLSLLSSLLLFCTFSNAQDTIVKTNGNRIGAKISEVSTTEVKYKKFDFQDGPTFIESKSNIKSIKYSNGTTEEFGSQQTTNTLKPTESNSDYYSAPVNQQDNKIGRQGNHFQYHGEAIDERAMQEVLFKSKDKQIILLAGNAKDAKGLQYLGFVGIPLGAGALFFLARSMFSANSYYSSGPNSRDLSLSAICLVGAVSCPIAAVYFKHKRNVSNKEAIKLYNAKY